VAGDDLELKGLSSENYEPAQEEIRRQEQDQNYLRIENLQKIYDNKFHAVKGINLKIYQNQIFALLG
jgi:ABC-type glutathione transport system ATPase component